MLHRDREAGFKLTRYTYPGQEGPSGLECLTEAAASMSASDEEERSMSSITPPGDPPSPPGPMTGVVRRSRLSQGEPPASAPAAEEPGRPVTRSQEEPPAPSAGGRKRPATPEEDEDAPVTKQRARDRAADRGTRTPPQTRGNGQEPVETLLPLDGATGSSSAARNDPERSDERARELTVFFLILLCLSSPRPSFSHLFPSCFCVGHRSTSRSCSPPWWRSLARRTAGSARPLCGRCTSSPARRYFFPCSFSSLCCCI